jgi:hypothetical protein
MHLRQVGQQRKGQRLLEYLAEQRRRPSPLRGFFTLSLTVKLCTIAAFISRRNECEARIVVVTTARAPICTSPAA